MVDQFDSNAQQPAPRKPAAGFYPDAQGVQRFWDGNAWTEHTQQMPAAAPVAPNAAAASQPEREWFKKKRFVIPLGLAALLVIGGALGGGEEADPAAAAAESTSAPVEAKATEEAEPAKAEATKATPAPKPKPKPKAKPVAVSAAEMLQAYEENELSADKKYKGKTIKVTGVVDKIDTEFFNNDQYVLRIGSGDEFAFLTVNCNDMSSDELSTLTVGGEVTAVGKFDDGGDLGVELKKCKLA